VLHKVHPGFMGEKGLRGRKSGESGKTSRRKASFFGGIKNGRKCESPRNFSRLPNGGGKSEKFIRKTLWGIKNSAEGVTVLLGH